MKKLKIASALLIASSFLALPALAQQCSDIQYRLWRANDAATWYGPGDTLEVYSGEEVHLYIHTRARSANSHYTTSADIGYPANFGGREDSRAVRQQIRMSAQNGDDKRSGRIRFVAEQAGQARLGYRIKGVKSPGDINRIPQACRTGFVNFNVVSRSTPSPKPQPPGGGNASPGDVGVELVELLYRALLRRERVASDPNDFVRQVLQLGKPGLETVADTMTNSREFRTQALKRTETAHGRVRGGLDGLREQLLDDIYRDLYGYLTPNRDDRQGDLADLGECLSDSRSSEQSCSRLARNLIDSNLFYEEHQELIDGLPNQRRRR